MEPVSPVVEVSLHAALPSALSTTYPWFGVIHKVEFCHIAQVTGGDVEQLGSVLNPEEC